MTEDSKGYSLHIGLNFVDPAHYEGWDGELIACENDANDMAALATSIGYKTQSLLRSNATRGAVKKAIKAIAKKLSEGDIFLVTYSGHGGQVPDLSGEEADGFDETWCLFDGQLLDDELDLLWHDFGAGVRIVVVSDSCHSGTITKAMPRADSSQSRS